MIDAIIIKFESKDDNRLINRGGVFLKVGSHSRQDNLDAKEVTTYSTLFSRYVPPLLERSFNNKFI
jgi:hypothetical protein